MISFHFSLKLQLFAGFFLISFLAQSQTSGFAFFSKKPTCPQNYILVPQNATYTSSDFCVMKFEAKAEIDAGGSFDTDGLSVNSSTHKPSSTPNHLPWRGMTWVPAATECQSLGDGYDLITNAQWQTLARNIELQGANWTSGTVGTGCLFQGNNGETTCGYDGANPESSSTNARGIFTLSNGATIHDFAGNASEWVKDSNGTNYGAADYFSNVTAATHTTTGTLLDGVSRSAKAQFGPSGSYGTGSNNSGLGYGELNSSAGAVGRSGDWDSGADVGIFSTCLNYSSLCPSGQITFRCTYNP